MFEAMLKKVLQAFGPSGNEGKVASVLAEEIRPYCDEVYTDALGNLIAHKRGTSGKKLMLSAHMDQIGFIVVDIDENGFLPHRQCRWNPPFAQRGAGSGL